MSKVVCLICGKEFKQLSSHIKVHNISIKQYREKFPNARTISEESHNKRSSSASGENNSFFGKKHTEKSKDKNRKAKNEFYLTDKGKEVKEKLREDHIGSKRSFDSRLKQGKSMSGFYQTQEGIELREQKSDNWMRDKNPNHGGISDEHLRNVFRAVNMRPNKEEIFMGEFLHKILLPYNIEYKYVGDGELVIHGKCPDFVIIKKDKNSNNIYGKKLIEFNGDFFHKNDDEGHRIFYFGLFGYETLIVWEHELKDLEKLRQRILDFHNLV